MRPLALFAALPLAAALLACGADAAPRQATAAEGAAPPIFDPVGPVPGPPRAEPAATRSNPFASDPMARVEGRQLFKRYNCAGCHGDHAGGGMGPSLRDESWMYGGGEADIFSSIAEGRAHGMPSWGTRLPAQQVWKLVTYIRSLRTPDEPEPPQP